MSISTIETQYVELCLEIDLLYKLGTEILNSIECIVIMVEGKKLFLTGHTQMRLSNSKFFFFFFHSSQEGIVHPKNTFFLGRKTAERKGKESV